MKHRITNTIFTLLPALMIASSFAEAESQLITYEGPKGIKASTLYTVTVNGKPVFVYPCTVGTIADDKGELLPNRHAVKKAESAAFCVFDFKGEVDVAATVHGPQLHLPLKSAIVRPLRQKIAPELEDNTIRFRLASPCKLSVEPNGSVVAPLFIFANSLETDCPKPDDPNVKYFSPGVHTLGFHDKVESNTTFYIAGGAVVYGHLWGDGVKNVRILGRGVLDCSRSPGEGSAWDARNEFGMNRRQIRFFKSKDIFIEGIVMLDSPSWGIELTHCDDVTVRNVKIITWRGACDAIDVCSSENVAVDDCFVRTHDDSLNVKGLTDLCYPANADGSWSPAGVRKPARNIRFTNCVVWNDRAHALMIGPETRTSAITNVLYRGIDIIHALSVDVLGIYSSDSAEISNIRYEDIRIEDPRCQTLFSIRVHPTYVTADPNCGPVSNVVYKDIQVTTHGPLYSGICGDKEKISGLTFENIRINGELMKNTEQMKLISRGQVEDVKVTVSSEE
ncbi:MAG: glycosyl hydrolase family 28 protein [Planctomycetota bacterium]|nr:glycosyl hydrolase family 28 protein [Planctomycetota bacterium]